MRSHFIVVASLAFALAGVACTVKTTGTGNENPLGDAGATDAGAKVDDDKPSTGTGNDAPKDDQPGTGTGTVGCAGIIQCIANCGDDQSCTGHCGDDATPSGIQFISALSDCLDANACQDDACMQQHCQSELDACLADQ